MGRYQKPSFEVLLKTPTILKYHYFNLPENMLNFNDCFFLAVVYDFSQMENIFNFSFFFFLACDNQDDILPFTKKKRWYTTFFFIGNERWYTTLELNNLDNYIHKKICIIIQKKKHENNFHNSRLWWCSAVIWSHVTRGKYRVTVSVRRISAGSDRTPPNNAPQFPQAQHSHFWRALSVFYFLLSYYIIG